MIRQQVYLPEGLERRLAVASKQQQKSEAELVGEALEDKLGAASPVSAGAALLKLVELGKRLDISLPADASARQMTISMETGSCTVTWSRKTGPFGVRKTR